MALMYSLASKKEEEHTETGVTLNESIPLHEVTTTQSSLFLNNFFIVE